MQRHVEDLGRIRPSGCLKISAYKNIHSREQFIEFLKTQKDKMEFGFEIIRKNLIVEMGLKIATRSLILQAPDFGIVGIAFGDGGAPISDMLTPLPPHFKDIELGNELFRTPIDSSGISYSDVTPISATVSGIAVAADYESVNYINEAGLVNNIPDKPNDPASQFDLFSRITFPSIPFAGSVTTAILAEWIIYIDSSSASS